jgi:hypothetical protein
MSNFPPSTTKSGWPEFICDTTGNQYVLLRDGTPTGDFTGHSCLYGKLDQGGYIDRDYQYVPAIGSTPEACTMSGGTWMTAGQMLAAGIPPIKIPDEPVVTPPVMTIPKYQIGDKLKADLVSRFMYHAPSGDQPERYGRIRDEIFKVAILICSNAPDSRERATALTHLDAAMMFANAAIARNESKP